MQYTANEEKEMDMDDLERKVAEMIIRRCKLTGIEVEECDFEAPLFLDDEVEVINGLELDSVDALELVAGVKEEFGLVLNANEMNVFYSVRTLADYIRTNANLVV